MKTETRHWELHQGASVDVLLPVLGLPTSGYGVRMHIRDAHDSVLPRLILSHDGAANLRVTATTAGIRIQIGASITGALDMPLERYTWVYSAEVYSLSDVDSVLKPVAGEVYAYKDVTREDDLETLPPIVSADGRYVRHDGAQGLSDAAQARAWANMGGDARAVAAVGDLGGGADGEDGWSPVLVTATNMSTGAVVLKVHDWIGGSGTKPATGQYLSTDGLTSDIDFAVGINGPPGSQGDPGAPGADGEDGAPGPTTTIAQVADGTTAGGNARGIFTTDWQQHRSDAGNAATGDYSSILGGSDNRASGIGSSCGGGAGNSATLNFATSVGGLTNQATAAQSTTLGGNDNLADGDVSVTVGGKCATVRGIYGAMAHASGQRAAKGDAQGMDLVLRGTSTSTTPVTLTSDGSAVGAVNQLVLANNMSITATAIYSGRVRSGGSGVIGGVIHFCIARGANAASTAIAGTNSVAHVVNTTGETIALTITADTTYGAPSVQLVGATGLTIDCTCRFIDVETA